MQKIIPHLWFDKEAKEAAELYTSVFREVFGSKYGASEITSTVTLHNTPSGNVEMLTIKLLDQEFMMISAGPYFAFNPAVSFLVACETKEEVEVLWGKLSQGGTPLMELGEYPFSEKYGWIQDRYGLSWQIMFMNDLKMEQKITPTLMFVGENCGKAEEAMNFYVSVFNNSSAPFGESKVGNVLRYIEGEGLDKAGTIKHGQFILAGQNFAAMDSAYDHKFSFNEAVSFVVNCETQEEIDYYWGQLSVVPEAEQCGWLKDKFGLSWQIVPTLMQEMFKENNEKKMAQVTEAFLAMKKFDIEKLKEAYGQ